MRNTNEITEEEMKAWLKKGQNLLNEPYRVELSRRQSEIFHTPKNNEWKPGMIYGLKAEYQMQWDEINDELGIFRRNKYPELVFEIEDDVKQKQIEKLKQDEEYKNLIHGITYFSGQIHSDQSAVDEIKALNRQISNLIKSKFPEIFS